MARREFAVAYGLAVGGLLRRSRRRQGLSQVQVAAMTGGAVSKSALANYESRYRSMRVDVFWLLAQALGEDAGALLSNAGAESAFISRARVSGLVTVDAQALRDSTDRRLAPVRRWFLLRFPSGPERPTVEQFTLDQAALVALAPLMGVDVTAARLILAELAMRPTAADGSGTGDRVPHKLRSG